MPADKIKVMTIFGTRPEIIRLSAVMRKLDEYTNQIIVHTGQNYAYELDGIFFEELELRKSDYYLEVKSNTLGGQIGNILIKSEEVLLKEKPDALLVLGDTNSCLSAIIAKRLKIPIFHMEAGNRCFDERVPEEINRKIIDHISDINLPYTEHGRRYLILEGIPPGSIYVTGSPLAEVLSYYKEKIDASTILNTLSLKKGEYFLISAHREENVDSKEVFLKLIDSFNALAEKYSKPLLVTTHPRTRNKIKEYGVEVNALINLHKPFGYFDYVYLQQNASCVLSDSGTIQEEASLLNFPAVQIRESSERPEAFDTGNVVLSGLDKDIILQAVEIVTGQFLADKKFEVPRDYQSINVSDKVLRLIVGLANIIKKKRK